MLGPPPLPRNLPAAIRDLVSAKAQTRASAIADLARHARGDEATRATAVPLLERALRDDVAIVRSAAALALADLGGKEALPALLVAVEDSDSHVRQMALTALGEIGDARARGRIERALTDERPDVRYQALIAFARVAAGDAEARAAAVVRALGDDDDDIRYMALRLAEDHRLETRAPVAAAARRLMGEKNPSVALVAALLLARAGDADAKRAVLAVVKHGAGGAQKADEQAALELAGELGWRDAMADLERRAFGVGRFVRDTASWNAKIALAAMGHARATSEIVADLSAWRRDARQAAVVAAGRARIVAAREKIESLRGDVDDELVTEALSRLAGAVS